jgi:hypothetical protein
MGVFLQPDPIGFKGDAANIYRFCNNNAVNRIDPMGLRDWEAVRRAMDQCALIPYFEAEAKAEARSLIMAPISKVAKGQSFEQRAGRLALKMLADETHHRPSVTQTGVITDGPPYRVGPVDERIVSRDPMNLDSPRVAREELRWRGPATQKVIFVHYHDRIGRLFGEPTQEHDLKMLSQGPMYFTNREWAATGKYFIYRAGQSKPDVMYSDSIIPSR